MIDTTGKCSVCGQTVGIDTIHTCSPQVTAPTPERRVGEARVREIERMLSMLTAPASELVPLKVDGRTFADMKQVFADWLALTAEVEAIEAAVREVCPLSDNEGYEDEDAGAVVYRCIGEDGDPLIETESRAEVIRGLLGLWHRVSDRAELLSHDFDELSKAFAATLAQDEIAHLNRECLKLGEDNQRLTAEVERLTKENRRLADRIDDHIAARTHERLL